MGDGGGGNWLVRMEWYLLPSRMVAVSASVGLPLHHKVQEFSSGTGSPGWSWKRAVKRLWCRVVVVLLWPNGCMHQDTTWYACRPRRRRHCVRWGPSSPGKGHSSPPLFGLCLLWPNSRQSQLLLSSCFKELHIIYRSHSQSNLVILAAESIFRPQCPYYVRRCGQLLPTE